jgi:hypothetical protein
MRRPGIVCALVLALLAGLPVGGLALARNGDQEPPNSPLPGRQPRIIVAAAAASAAADSLRRALDEAAIDSLNAWWRRLDDAWYEPLTPDLLESGLDNATLDSLSSVGDRELTALLGGRRWKLTLRPLAGTGFNRCEGWRPASGAVLRRLGRQGAVVTLGAGYGIARRRVVWDAAVAWPLAAARPVERPDRSPRRPWTRWALTVAGGDGVVPFAGNGGLARTLDAILSGEDPCMYYARRRGEAAVAWRPARRLEARAGALRERHRPLAVTTTWNLSGEADRVPLNWAVDPLDSRALTAGLGWTGSRLEVDTRAEWHRATGAASGLPVGDVPDRRDFLRLAARARGSWLDRHGNEFAARVIWSGVDRAAPLQWKTFLGGSNSLRGYPARELAGDRGLLAAIDARAGCDPLHALRVPLLGRLRLQPILFADFGRADAAGLPVSPEGADGWRADVGFGIGRLLGAGGRGNLRLYFAKPVMNGQADRPWQVQFELEL